MGTQVGRLGDMFGRVRMYNTGFLIFAIGSALCGLSTNSFEIIVFRILQGAGGALISSNSGAIIADTFPSERRGRAYGITAVGWSAGAILGIVLGGVIITFVNWRYIFFINVPIGVAAFFLGRYILKERVKPTNRGFDIPGMILFGGGLLSLLLGLTDIAGSRVDYYNIGTLVLSFFLILAFSAWEMRANAPLLRLSILRRRVLSASFLASLFQGLGNFAILFLIIMYLQGVQKLSPFNASLLLVPGYALSAVFAPIGGRLADKRGARFPASLGLCVQAIGVSIYFLLTPTSPSWLVIIGTVIAGTGSAFFFPANSSAVMANSEQEIFGVASGLLRTFANIGLTASIAVAIVAASSSISRSEAFKIFLGTDVLSSTSASAFVQGLHTAFAVSIAFVLIALVLSLIRGKEVRGQQKEMTR
jgi:EmrB/QacA subfamily drug resistance transporter